MIWVYLDWQLRKKWICSAIWSALSVPKWSFSLWESVSVSESSCSLRSRRSSSVKIVGCHVWVQCDSQGNMTKGQELRSASIMVAVAVERSLRSSSLTSHFGLDQICVSFRSYVSGRIQDGIVVVRAQPAGLWSEPFRLQVGRLNDLGQGASRNPSVCSCPCPVLALLK